MTSKHLLATSTALLATIAGCSSQSQGFRSQFDPATRADALTPAQFTALCEDWRSYVLVQAGQERYDTFVIHVQLAGSESVARCEELRPTYEAGRPYSLSSTPCSETAAGRDRCGTVTVGEIERLVDVLASSLDAHLDTLEPHLNCRGAVEQADPLRRLPSLTLDARQREVYRCMFASEPPSL